MPRDYAPKEVAAMLNEARNELLCVRGNCEAEVDQMMLDFPVMAEYMILYLDDRMVFATHGHVFNREHLPALKKGDILLNGHTHVPAIQRMEEGILYLNPGSVAIPKENSACSYMIYEDGEFRLEEL